MSRFFVAARLGFEPRLHGPEPCVLPLDDLAIVLFIQQIILYLSEMSKYPFSQLIVKIFNQMRKEKN